MKTACTSILALIVLTSASYKLTFAHCDTMDGPVVADARRSIAQNNVNYILKWVAPDKEKQIKDAFDLTMKMRKRYPDSSESTDRYLFETVIRIHRKGEGVKFTGIKPSGTPIDEKIRAADKSIELGTLAPLENVVSDDMLPELNEYFKRVMSLKDFDVNDVKSGREYVKAYVQFFHFAEGEGAHGHEHRQHVGHIPWIIIGAIFILSLALGVYSQKQKREKRITTF